MLRSSTRKLITGLAALALAATALSGPAAAQTPPQ